MLERRFEDALEVMEPGEAIFRERRNHTGLMYLVNAQAKAYYGLQDWSRFDAALRECFELITKFPTEPTAAELLLLIVYAISQQHSTIAFDQVPPALVESIFASRADTPAGKLLSTALAEEFAPTSIRAIGEHLFGENARDLADSNRPA